MIYVSVTWGVHILQLMLWKKIRQLRLIASQTLNPEEKSKVRGLQKLQQGATHVTDTRVLPENGGNVSEPKQGPIEGNKAKLSSCY
ncbi:hypothetical protein CY35_02G104900 [Sphagnum magellanicum]|nr:hypothetical protein CY35_02G104900 [Sphagnum magellanicum]